MIKLARVRRLHDQQQIAHLMQARGFEVTQASISRDVRELGLVKLEGRYVAASDLLAGEGGNAGTSVEGAAGSGDQGVTGPRNQGTKGPRIRGIKGSRADEAVGDAGGGAATEGLRYGGGRGAAAVRSEGSEGSERSEADGLHARLSELITGAEPVGSNLVVVRTPIGAAGAVGVALDDEKLPEVAGTIAGDDTLFVAVKSRAAQGRLLARIRACLKP